MSLKCRKCPGWKNCEWCFKDECWYEPNDHPGGIGSATAEECKKQNEYIDVSKR